MPGTSEPSCTADSGLCATCIHARTIESAKGSKFLLCRRSATDPSYPKYPRLPVFSCPGYEAVSADNSTETPVSAQPQSATSLQMRVPEGTGTVSITSDPEGAEIFVDDKFFGEAPATLRLPVGTHSIVLKIPGHADWHRTLEVLKGNKTTLKAVLDAAP
jgi:PEGA domain-containing protein